MIFLHGVPEDFRAGKIRAGFHPATKKNDNKNPVDKGEHPIMQTEKRDKKKFAGPGQGILRCGTEHLQHVERADNDVPGPEQKHQRKNFPMKKQHTEHRHQVGQQQGNDGWAPPVGDGGFAKNFQRVHAGELPAIR
jgi:hypothetical protein